MSSVEEATSSSGRVGRPSPRPIPVEGRRLNRIDDGSVHKLP